MLAFLQQPSARRAHAVVLASTPKAATVTAVVPAATSNVASVTAVNQRPDPTEASATALFPAATSKAGVAAVPTATSKRGELSWQNNRSVDSSYRQETTKKRLAAPKLKRTASSQGTASEKSKQKKSRSKSSVRVLSARTLGNKTNQKSSSDTAKALKEELKRRACASAAKFINAQMSFSPAEQSWMGTKYYRDVGAAYLTGVVTSYRFINEVNEDNIGVPVPMFKIQWTNTAFQTKDHVHEIGDETVIRGVAQFIRMHEGHTEFTESWKPLYNMFPKYSNIPVLTEEFEELDDAGYRDLNVFRGRK
ncbi:hypothetical protein PI125_g7389 [Phytophthora idaei]|nr:hypothetical protein PI125_g7389 [Phytophthora idaei]KAG3156079.1 hypothetical protein PI126_g8908 [Phytophthora idaei]